VVAIVWNLVVGIIIVGLAAFGSFAASGIDAQRFCAESTWETI
jgi:hypothetical protein